MTVKEALRRIETKEQKCIAFLVRIGYKNGKDIYSVTFMDNTEKDYYINLETDYVEEA